MAGAFVLFSALAASAQFVFQHVNVSNSAETNAYGLNNARTIVGTAATTQQDMNGIEWGFIRWKSGATARPIRPPGAADSDLNGINTHGDTVGTYGLNDSFGVRFADLCFIRENGHYTTFAVPIGTQGFPDCNGINNAGDTVGSVEDAFFGPFGGNHGWMRTDDGVFTQLDVPGAINTEATGINEAKTIVGFYTDANFNDHGFSYSGGTYTFPIDFPGGNDTNIFGINNKNEIVGSYVDPMSSVDHGFLQRTDGTFLSIDVTFPNLETNSARGVNDNSWIVGIYTDPDGHNKAFLTREP